MVTEVRWLNKEAGQINWEGLDSVEDKVNYIRQFVLPNTNSRLRPQGKLVTGEERRNIIYQLKLENFKKNFPSLAESFSDWNSIFNEKEGIVQDAIINSITASSSDVSILLKAVSEEISKTLVAQDYLIEIGMLIDDALLTGENLAEVKKLNATFNEQTTTEEWKTLSKNEKKEKLEAHEKLIWSKLSTLSKIIKLPMESLVDPKDEIRIRSKYVVKPGMDVKTRNEIKRKRIEELEKLRDAALRVQVRKYYTNPRAYVLPRVVKM